jgi:hypothetical protein
MKTGVLYGVPVFVFVADALRMTTTATPSILPITSSDTLGAARENGGESIMGDKSPKSNKKQANQKQGKADSAQQKKKDTDAAKKADSGKK